jgi:hypothetical protein
MAGTVKPANPPSTILREIILVSFNEARSKCNPAAMPELDAAGLVRVGGGHSVTLKEGGRQLLKKPAVRRPSKRSGQAR